MSTRCKKGGPWDPAFSGPLPLPVLSPSPSMSALGLFPEPHLSTSALWPLPSGVCPSPSFSVCVCLSPALCLSLCLSPHPLCFSSGRINSRCAGGAWGRPRHFPSVCPAHSPPQDHPHPGLHFVPGNKQPKVSSPGIWKGAHIPQSPQVLDSLRSNCGLMRQRGPGWARGSPQQTVLARKHARMTTCRPEAVHSRAETINEWHESLLTPQAFMERRLCAWPVAVSLAY